MGIPAIAKKRAARVMEQVVNCDYSSDSVATTVVARCRILAPWESARLVVETAQSRAQWHAAAPLFGSRACVLRFSAIPFRQYIQASIFVVLDRSYKTYQSLQTTANFSPSGRDLSAVLGSRGGRLLFDINIMPCKLPSIIFIIIPRLQWP